MVAAQHGNEIISSDDKVLLNQFLESLLQEEKVVENISGRTDINQAQSVPYDNSPTVDNTHPQSDLNSDYESPTSESPTNQEDSTPHVVSNQNVGLSSDELAELEHLDNQQHQENIDKQPVINPQQTIPSLIQNEQSPSSFVENNHVNKVPQQQSGYNQNNLNQHNYNQPSLNNQQQPVDVVKTTDTDQVFNQLETSLNQYHGGVPPKVETKPESPQEQEVAKLQAHNARYSFASSIDDNIQGNYQQHVEVRKEGKVYGRYSYDDGNNFVTRYYIADENGFRIVK